VHQLQWKFKKRHHQSVRKDLAQRDSMITSSISAKKRKFAAEDVQQHRKRKCIRIDALPEEILLLIFNNLDAESIESAMLVAKFWCEVITNSTPTMNHMAKQSVIINVRYLPLTKNPAIMRRVECLTLHKFTQYETVLEFMRSVPQVECLTIDKLDGIKTCNTDFWATLSSILHQLKNLRINVLNQRNILYLQLPQLKTLQINTIGSDISEQSWMQFRRNNPNLRNVLTRQATVEKFFRNSRSFRQLQTSSLECCERETLRFFYR